jgi:DnaK suppressor protein
MTEPEGVAGLLAAERAGTVARLTALEQEFAGILEASGSAGTDDEHDPEGATIAFEREHAAALLAQLREHVAQIDAALGRLADGTYGTCANCGRPIGTARLSARPVATACIDCASRR